MKIKGKKIAGPNVETVIIPRSNGQHIVFKCAAVLDYSDFEKLCPDPKPPKVQKPGGEWLDDIESGDYKIATNLHLMQNMNWMILRSLSATDDLEWEKVKLSDPTTWELWTEELKEAGFSRIEIGRIRDGVWKANCLDEKMIDEARKSFFHSQGVQGN